jgi:hypothetical protein
MRIPNDEMWWPVKLTEVRGHEGIDPSQYVISENIHRNHLTVAEQRDVIARLLQAHSDKSDRQIAEMAKDEHKKVGRVRANLEARGAMPHVERRTDTKGRKQPTRKPPKKTPEDAPLQAEGGFPIYGPCAGGRVVTKRSNTAQKKLKSVAANGADAPGPGRQANFDQSKPTGSDDNIDPNALGRILLSAVEATNVLSNWGPISERRKKQIAKQVGAMQAALSELLRLLELEQRTAPPVGDELGIPHCLRRT